MPDSFYGDIMLAALVASIIVGLLIACHAKGR